MPQGQLTPTQLNLIAAFNQGRGINLNPDAVAYQGTWTPAQYLPGSLVNNTVLRDLTQALGLIHGVVTPDLYRRLTSIGEIVCPALGNSRPTTFRRNYAGNTDPYPPSDYPNTANQGWLGGWASGSYIKIDDLFSDYWEHGFIGCIARQAYYEIFQDNPNQYPVFCTAWGSHQGWLSSQNPIVGSFNNAKTWNLGTYSNITDLTTANISGVSRSFKLWGRDLVNLGRVLNLSGLHRAGLPSVLLQTLSQAGALTDAIKFQLLYVLEIEEVNNIIGTGQATQIQEVKIYGAFGNIQGQDLDAVRVITNCATPGLRSLADLLDPRYMFPSSFQTLTVPRYSTDTTSYKIYDLIYDQTGGVNNTIPARGAYLVGILPQDVASAVSNWAYSMLQISNIVNMDPLQFAQVVLNLEDTGQDLPSLTNNQAAPTNQEFVYSYLGQNAFGSGPGGTYRTCDFWASASGVPYVFWYSDLEQKLNAVATPQLRNIYAQILAAAQAVPPSESLLGSLADQANAEILNISVTNVRGKEELNTVWDRMGAQLTTEQRAIVLSLPDASVYSSDINRQNIISFVQSLESDALDTALGGSNQVLSALAGSLVSNAVLNSVPSPTSIAQSSLIASLRAIRNNARIQGLGVIPQDTVPSTAAGLQGPVSGSTNTPPPLTGPQQATADAEIVAGALTVTVTSGGSGYDPCQPPRVLVWPLPTARVNAVLNPRIDETTGTVTEIVVTNATEIWGYPANIRPVIWIDPPPGPTPQGGPIVAGSQSGSPYVYYVPANLVTSADQSPDVQAARQSINR